MSEVGPGDGKEQEPRLDRERPSSDGGATVLPGWLAHLAGAGPRVLIDGPGSVLRLAAVLRSLIVLLSDSSISDGDLEGSEELIEGLAALLSRAQVSSAGKPTMAGVALTDSESFLDRSPFIGLGNPLSPPVIVQIVRDVDDSWVVIGSVTFGSLYEGPPGYVHGGFLAAVFDEICGLAQSLAGQPAMTAHLSVDYRRPTPLWSEVEFSARLERIEGRKHFASAVARVQGVETATAEALFVTVDFETLRARRNE
ncbi:MAG: PaaI family thioesterase [Acidimicrobiales bacterium]